MTTILVHLPVILTMPLLVLTRARARVPRRTAAYFAPRLTGLINHWSLERLHAGTT